MSRHYKSVFTDEQELLQALIDIHLGGNDIQADPMYFKGNFYKNGIKPPKYKFDLTPQTDDTVLGDARNLPLADNSLDNMILDPPFLFGIHGKTKDYYSSKTHTIFKDFDDLYMCYEGIINEAKRILKKNGILIFKCQDYTDSSTTMTHVHAYYLATLAGFYAKDLAILVKPNKVYNGNTTQRHLRKIHTYFWVFQNKKGNL